MALVSGESLRGALPSIGTIHSVSNNPIDREWNLADELCRVECQSRDSTLWRGGVRARAMYTTSGSGIPTSLSADARQSQKGSAVLWEEDYEMCNGG